MNSKPLNRLLKRALIQPFCRDNKLPSSRMNQHKELMQNKLRQMIPNSYNPKIFLKMNDQKFIEQIERIHYELTKPKIEEQTDKVVKNSQYPFLFGFLFLFIYWMWQSCPFTAIYKYFTISEHLFKYPLYLMHTVFTASLSIRDWNEFLNYFPLMSYALFALTPRMSSRFFFYGFLANALVTTIVLIAYEKVMLSGSNLMLPKTNGGSTALFFATLLYSLNPQHLILGIPFAPYIILLSFVVAIELRQKEVDKKCRESLPAHLTAVIMALVFGMAMKRRNKVLDLI